MELIALILDPRFKALPQWTSMDVRDAAKKALAQHYNMLKESEYPVDLPVVPPPAKKSRLEDLGNCVAPEKSECTPPLFFLSC